MEGDRVIIQIERPEAVGHRMRMEDARELLKDTGIELDDDYGPIPVNPKLGRYVVRGVASQDARRRAEILQGVTIFADSPQRPFEE